MMTVISILAVTGISCLSLKFFPVPFLWAFLSWSIFFFLQSKHFVRSKLRILSFNIGAILLVFALFESILPILDNRHSKAESHTLLERVYESHIDNILGYAPNKNTTRHASKYINDNLIYKVEISIDKNGLRISPPCREDSENAILFFGGSFTFGEGVNDNQTMPFRVGVESEGEYCIYNFGLYGYGTHQMLSAIENGRVASIVQENVRYVVYQALYPEHVYRLAGVRQWQKGPKYVLGKDGSPHFEGLYRDYDSGYGFWIWLFKLQLQKSALLKKIFDFGIHINEADKDLFIAIVSQSRRLLLDQHPMAEIHLIVWRGSTKDEDLRVFEKLKSENIKIHFIEDILPNIHTPSDTYVVNKLDRHPNALTHSIIAKYIQEEIIH